MQNFAPQQCFCVQMDIAQQSILLAGNRALRIFLQQLQLQVCKADNLAKLLPFANAVN